VVQCCDILKTGTSMKMSPFLTKSILLLSLIVVGANDSLCPNKCVCRRMNQRDEIKLRCGEADKKINHLEEIDLLNIANEIVQFNLSNNFLTTFFPKSTTYRSSEIGPK
jgi:hypothetical protein